MADLADSSLMVRTFMRAYRYTSSVWRPATLRAPLSECRFVLVTTAALHLPEQPPFASTVNGDADFREIPTDADLPTLVTGHRSQSFDHTAMEADKNLVLPIDRFREFVAAGEIGSLNHRHWSFMGSILKPDDLIRRTAPEAARRAAADGVDAALLTPV
jgi:D-proline reductase (dithiol) PrdB